MAQPTFRRFGKTDQPLPVATEQVTTTPATDAPKAKRLNRFGAKCASCGTWVEAEQGELSGSSATGWKTRCFPVCATTTAPAAPAATPAPASRVTNQVNGETLYDGTYTLSTTEGHRTFRLRTQAVDSDFMPGVQIIQVLSGSDNEGDYTSIGHIKSGRLSIWKRHQAKTDLVAEAQAFVANPHSEDVVAAIACFACGRKLTVPASVHDGLGPECSKRAR